MAPPPSPSRESYLLEMRARFCLPEMLEPGPSRRLDFSYFKPRALPSSAWTAEDDARLMRGLRASGVGVGAWARLRRDFLPGRDENELRLRCMQWLGVQDLRGYEGRVFSGGGGEVRRERDANLEKARAAGTKLVHGVVPHPDFGRLVGEDDDEEVEGGETALAPLIEEGGADDVENGSGAPPPTQGKKRARVNEDEGDADAS